MTNAGLMAQTARPFRRLVVAPSEIAPPVKRHRDHQTGIGGKFDEQPRAKSCQKGVSCNLSPCL